MPRYGLFLNEEDDEEIIDFLKGKNVSAKIRNALKGYLQFKKQSDILNELTDIEKRMTDEINKCYVNLERQIENLKLNMQLQNVNKSTTEQKKPSTQPKITFESDDSAKIDI